MRDQHRKARIVRDVVGICCAIPVALGFDMVYRLAPWAGGALLGACLGCWFVLIARVLVPIGDER